MQVLRTPDEAFADLVDYPFAPHFSEVADGDGGSLRVHHVDEGPRDGAVVVLLHGEPSWSYLYRHVIPPLVAAGHRVVAPDLVGFGRSDKPTEQSDYTYARHVEWMRELLFDHLDLTDVTLFAQDWGGLVGLRLVGEHPDRFARVVVGNTGLPTGEQQLSEALQWWREYSRTCEVFATSQIINGATTRDLSPAEQAAYDAPFPDASYQAGARIFPSLIPVAPDDPGGPENRAAWASLATFERPLLCAYSDQDPMTGGADKPFRTLVPGAQGQPHRTIEGAGHFLQEDAPDQVAQAILDAMAL